MNYQRGASSILWGVVAFAVLAGAFGIYRWVRQDPGPGLEANRMKENEGGSGPTVAEGVGEGDGPTISLEFSGQTLAGSTSPLIDFNKDDFDKAVASDRLVVLYFYANWCPICRAEFPRMEDAFNSLSGDGVVGFRVNYNDDETDNDERNLAREHGVAYQHTKVFIKNGQRVLKSPESWNSAQKYIDEISKHK